MFWSRVMEYALYRLPQNGTIKSMGYRKKSKKSLSNRGLLIAFEAEDVFSLQLLLKLGFFTKGLDRDKQKLKEQNPSK